MYDNDFELVNMSVGKEGANINGSIAYLVTYYLNKSKTNNLNAIGRLELTSPTGAETCMMYRSFDLRAQFNVGTIN